MTTIAKQKTAQAIEIPSFPRYQALAISPMDLKPSIAQQPPLEQAADDFQRLHVEYVGKCDELAKARQAIALLSESATAKLPSGENNLFDALSKQLKAAADATAAAEALQLAEELADELALNLPVLKAARDVAALRADYFEALQLCEPAAAKYREAIEQAKAAARQFDELHSEHVFDLATYGVVAGGGHVWSKFVDLPELPTLVGSPESGGFHVV